MKSLETRTRVLDAHYDKHRRMVERLVRYYNGKSTEELRYMRFEVAREQQTLGNIPLLASTTPIVFLIFGSHLGRYFPQDGIGWVVVAVLSIMVIFWSINHHFRQRGRLHLDQFLIDEILKERRSQNPASSVK
ncbi:MAG: hypothetical protein WCC10_06710 [Tumebacillaceae bacterium]